MRLSDKWPELDPLADCDAPEPLERALELVEEAKKRMMQIHEKRGDTPWITAFVEDFGGVRLLNVTRAACWLPEGHADQNPMLAEIVQASPTIVLFSTRQGVTTKMVHEAHCAVMILKYARAARHHGLLNGTDLDATERTVARLLSEKIVPALCADALEVVNDALLYGGSGTAAAHTEQFATKVLELQSMSETRVHWVQLRARLDAALVGVAGGFDPEDPNRKQDLLKRADHVKLRNSEAFLQNCGEALWSTPEYCPKEHASLQKRIAEAFAPRFLDAVRVEEETPVEERAQARVSDEAVHSIAERLARGDITAEEAMKELQTQRP